MTSEFLKILEIVSFDDTLFRKEFVKTLGWVSKEEYSIIEEWMVYHQYSDKFPDLLNFMKRFES